MTSRAVLVLAVIAVAIVAAVALPRRLWPTEAPPASPALVERRSADAIARMNPRIARSDLRLEHDPAQGFLRAVLRELDIPIESQVLVFSKTSRQHALIGETTPRAIYFNERASVGWVPGADVLEIVEANGDGIGASFYTLDQSSTSLSPPQFKAGTRCFECHTLPATGGLQGLLMRSLDLSSGVAGPLRTSGVDDRTVFDGRWSGWYVTGAALPPSHLGRAVSAAVDLRAYPSPQSDVVALLVLGHQVEMTNLLLRFQESWRAHEGGQVGQGGPGGHVGQDTGPTEISRLVNDVVDYMVFAHAAPWPGLVRGDAGFAAAFQAGGRRDARGRSLRDLDLERRLFRYPCSYMIDAPVFERLPSEAKQAVYARLSAVLSEANREPPYAHLSTDDRQAIRAVLRDTKTDLPPDFGL